MPLYNKKIARTNAIKNGNLDYIEKYYGWYSKIVN